MLEEQRLERMCRDIKRSRNLSAVNERMYKTNKTGSNAGCVDLGLKGSDMWSEKSRGCRTPRVTFRLGIDISGARAREAQYRRREAGPDRNIAGRAGHVLHPRAPLGLVRLAETHLSVDLHHCRSYSERVEHTIGIYGQLQQV
jgi:hypothetical protein